MKRLRKHGATRWMILLAVFCMTVGPLARAQAISLALTQIVNRQSSIENLQLPPGLFQALTPELARKVDAKGPQGVPSRLTPHASRLLTDAEMRAIKGRGPYRNKYFSGVLPWQRSLRDVNLCNGNLFKSFTDIQVAPAKGAGLVLQRTYNSQDPRIGPFGIGWTHAYDIFLEEDGSNDVPREDFFGGRHKYHRDADGLYSPPPYLFDELSSEYTCPRWTIRPSPPTRRRAWTAPSSTSSPTEPSATATTSKTVTATARR